MSFSPITFTVLGKAQPAGSKKAFAHPSTGRPIVVDANAKAKPWKQEVAGAARDVYDGPLLDEALAVRFDFYVVRPRSHFGSGKNFDRLKATAPIHPTVRPDLLKLARAIEDALSGTVYVDDSLIVDEVLTKRYGAYEYVRVFINSVAFLREVQAA